MPRSTSTEPCAHSRRKGWTESSTAIPSREVRDIETGEILWETRLSAAAHGYPITYEAGGRQFLAVPASLGGAFRSLTAQLSPEIYQPEGGNVLYVFALPEPVGIP